MIRRGILAPVICMIFVMGLIGAPFSQEALAQTKATKTLKHVAAKKTGHAKGKSHTKASVSSHRHHKKHALAQHTKKASRHRHAHSLASKTRRVFDPIPGYELPSMQPSDLWLAKDFPEKYKQMTTESGQGELTLKILESAYNYLGTPYRYGGTTPEGFDCSGFVRHVYSENGIPLGRSSRDQAMEGRAVPLSDLKPGDLIFFSMHRRKHYWIDHVGLYVGNGQFIHAASSRTREIKVETLESSRYLSKVVEARRILDYTR
jgi:cell wall-associated NlpC family hydrolase